jgi:ATP-dependent Clp protease ATP-binding subunit ClpX
MAWFSKSQPPSPQTTPATPAPAARAPAAPADGLACSFCGKHQREVRKLIAGPSVYICDECIGTCNDIVAEEAEADDASAPLAIPEPSDLDEAIEEHLVGAVAARRSMVAALRRHFLGSAQPGSTQRAPRVLVVGPTGCGKTTMGRALCAATTLPSYHADAGRLSESGYIGEDVENFIGGLLVNAGGDAAGAARGVLFLDGLEKIKAEHPLTRSRDISGESVQRELFRLLDGAEVEIPQQVVARHPQAPVVRVDCRGVFIAAAVRLEAAPASRGSERELRDAVCAAGLLPELVARFDRVVEIPPLDADGLAALVHHPRGPLAEATRIVGALGGTLELAPAAVRALAQAAALRPEGAWMLGQAVYRQLEEILNAPEPARAWRVDERAILALLRQA